MDTIYFISLIVFGVIFVASIAAAILGFINDKLKN